MLFIYLFVFLHLVISVQIDHQVRAGTSNSLITFYCCRCKETIHFVCVNITDGVFDLVSSVCVCVCVCAQIKSIL